LNLSYWLFDECWSIHINGLAADGIIHAWRYIWKLLRHLEFHDSHAYWRTHWQPSTVVCSVVICRLLFIQSVSRIVALITCVQIWALTLVSAAVNFINVYTRVFCTKFWRQSWNVSRKSCQKRHSYEKFICKTLMKLTPVVVNFINIICAHFSYEFFAKAKTYLENAAKKGVHTKNVYVKYWWNWHLGSKTFVHAYTTGTCAHHFICNSNCILTFVP